MVGFKKSALVAIVVVASATAATVIGTAAAGVNFAIKQVEGKA